MITKHFAIVLGCAVPAILFADQQPVFRSSVDLVSVHVSVKQGKTPVSGLTAGDFILLDNGVRQDIQALAVQSEAIDVTMLLDTSSSVLGRLFSQLTRDVDAVRRELNDQDRLRVMSFAHAVTGQSEFHSRAEPIHWSTWPQGGGTSVFDALTAAMIQAPTPERSHVVIALTDGRDTTSIFDAQDALEIARRTEAVVHIALAWQRDRFLNGLAEPALPVSPVDEVAVATGGTAFSFNVAQPFAELFRGLIADFRTGYDLKYAVKGVARTGWHDLSLTIRRSGSYAIRAKRGYFAGR